MQDFVVVTASEKATKTRGLLVFSLGRLLWVKQKRSVLLSACGCFLLWQDESIRPPKYSRNLPDLLHNGRLVHGPKVWQPRSPHFTSLSSSLHLGRGGACDIYTSKQCLQLQEEEINGDWQQRPGNVMFWRAFNYVYHRYTEDNKIVWAEHKHSGDGVYRTLRAIITPLTKTLDGLGINEEDSKRLVRNYWMERHDVSQKQKRRAHNYVVLLSEAQLSSLR